MNQSSPTVLIADDPALAVALSQAGFSVQVTGGGGPADFDRILACQFGDICVDFRKGLVLRRESPISLTLKELQLLRYLIMRKGSTVSRAELLAAVWGYRGHLTRTVDVHVASLRQKMEDDPHRPKYVRTVRGKGYLFNG